MQDIVVDALQHVFRKDEETAWTIVQSKQSTRPPPSTKYSESVRSALKNHESIENPGCKFTFENDLFLSPVYKRLLLRSLSAPDFIDDQLPQETSSVLTDELDNNGTRHGPQTRVDHASCRPPSSSGEFDLTPNYIANTLRSVGDFSAGVQADLENLRQTMGRFNLPKRSLPLRSALRQAQMEPEQQSHLNEQLVRAALTSNENLLALALDGGAEINAVGDDDRSALDICVSQSPYSVIAELLLLYRETVIHSKGSDKRTLLHLSILSGNFSMVAFLRKAGLDTTLSHQTPRPYVAPAFSFQDLAPFRGINRILALNSINPDGVPMYEGKSALHLAAADGDADFGATLVHVGCNPYAHIQTSIGKETKSELCDSALFLAIKLGHTEFVRKVLDACATCPITHLEAAEFGQDNMMQLVGIAERDGLQEIAEFLLSKWAGWHLETPARDSRLSSYARTAPTQDRAALFLTLMSKVCLRTSRGKFVDLTPFVSHIWAICDEEWAIDVFRGLQSCPWTCAVYYETGTVWPEATDHGMHHLEHLLVQILYARGRAWARSGRRGEVRRPDIFVQPPTDGDRKKRNALAQRLTREGCPIFNWKGVQTTTLISHELHYVFEGTTSGSIGRLYFFPDAEGHTRLVTDSRELLSTYAAWKDLGPEEDREKSFHEELKRKKKPENEYQGLW